MDRSSIRLGYSRNRCRHPHKAEGIERGIGYVALAIYKYKRINPGTSLFWMNGIIFAFGAYVIDWKIIILAVVCQWISTRIINWIHQFLPEVGLSTRLAQKVILYTCKSDLTNLTKYGNLGRTTYIK